MATSEITQVQELVKKRLTDLESILQLKEGQLARKCGKTDINVDIRAHLQTLKSSSSAVASNPLSDVNIQRKLEGKQQRAKANYDLITKTEAMKIPTTVSADLSLINSIKALDNASNKLPSLAANSSLSQIHRANVLINSADDAWIFSLDPSKNLVLPKPRQDRQTKCRICNSQVRTNESPTTDFLLCATHQRDPEEFANTIRSIYGDESHALSPTDRTQFH